jgi:tRNA pseudouridine32 synthase/23S rRNA pseudouridine746 synthase
MAPVFGELKILVVSKRFLVVDKPSGLLSVPGKGEANQDCVARRVKGMMPQASGPFVVHRLDMETSGLMVLARDADAHRHLSRQFETRAVSKVYEAVVMGEVEGESGTISLPIRPDIDNRPMQIVDWEHGRESVTRWKVMRREGGRTRVQFEPITGRTHQLRIHAATPRTIAPPPGSALKEIRGGLGFPIVGDTLYGDGYASGPRLLLHARFLAFIDPETRRPERCESETPF